MAYTANDVIGFIGNIMRTNTSSTDLPALQQAFLITLISDSNLRWARMFRKGGGAEPLVFMRETGFTLASETQVSNAAGVLTTDVTVTVQTTAGFGTSIAEAAVFYDQFMPDIFYYTGLTATTFTGVTGIGFAHPQNTIVGPLYKLPSDFKTFRPAELYGDGIQLNGIPMKFMQGPPIAGYFSMVDNGTNKFLWLYRGATGKASVLYEKTSGSIAQPSDTLDVPDEHIFYVVWDVIRTIVIPKEGSQPSPLYQIATKEAAQRLQDALNDRNIGRHARVKQFRKLGNYRDASLFLHVPR